MTPGVLSRLNRCDILYPVVFHRIDLLRHRNGFELGVDLALHDVLNGIGVLISWIQPVIIGVPLQNHGHPIMNVLHRCTGFPCKNRAGEIRIGLAFLVPVFPRPGKSKGISIGKRNEHGLFVALFSRPLVKTISQDQATSFFERHPKTRLGGRRFGSGVDHAAADRWILGTERYKHLLELHQMVLVRLFDNG